MESSALRPSLFANVPPFINFVPTLPSPGRRPPQRGPQYWDREGWDQAHLWRIPQAFRNWIEQSVKEAEAEIDYSFADAFAAIYDFDRRFGVALRKVGLKVTFRWRNAVGSTLHCHVQKKQRRSVHFQAIADPFEERADDCIEFLEDHPGVRLQMFPKMLELCSKDQLADNMRKMMERFPEGVQLYSTGTNCCKLIGEKNGSSIESLPRL